MMKSDTTGQNPWGKKNKKEKTTPPLGDFLWYIVHHVVHSYGFIFLVSAKMLHGDLKHQ